MSFTARFTPLRRLSVFLAGMLAALPGAPVLAQDEAPRWYRVEVVIFEHRDLGDASLEVWPADPGLPDTAMVADLKSPPEGMSVTFTDGLELSGAARQLSRSGRYEPLLHFAWTQQGLDQRRAIPLRVRGGVVYPPLPAPSQPERSPLQAPGVAVGATPSSAITPGRSAGATSFAIAPEAPVAPPVLHQLDGTLTLVLGRYLHLYADLIDRRLLAPEALSFSEGQPPTYENGQALVSFRVQAHRKMRSKELHYIDHPILGFLVKALPVDAPLPLHPAPRVNESEPTEPATTPPPAT